MKQDDDTHNMLISVQFSCSAVYDSLWPPWTAACQASLSIINSRSLLKLMSIESVMPSNCLILCYPLLLLPSIFPSIMVFSNESVLHIRWPKYWSFSFSISLSNEYSELISFRKRRREWQTTSVFLLWDDHEQYEKARLITSYQQRSGIHHWGIVQHRVIAIS